MTPTAQEYRKKMTTKMDFITARYDAFYENDMNHKPKVKPIKGWAITDWGGGIRHPSVSIFDTKNDAMLELKKLNKLPDSTIEGERNKIIPVLISPIKKKK